MPAGTVEPGEAIDAALWREIEEEAGLAAAQLSGLRKLGEVCEAEWDQRRHVFALEAGDALPDRWSHTVRSQGEDQGLVFEFDWLDVTPGLRLVGGQEKFLPLAATHRAE